MDPTLCTPLKNRGITVAVLYIPYPPITNPNPNFANNEDGKVNAIIPDIPTELQQCASPGFYCQFFGFKPPSSDGKRL